MITFSRAQLLVHLLRLPLSERMEPSVSFNFEAALGLVPGGYDANYATFLEMVHPQDRALFEREVKSTLEEGTDFKIEFRSVTSDGSILWTRAHGQVLFDEAGKPIRMIGVSTGVI